MKGGNMTDSDFIKPHVLFNDLNQTKPSRFFDFRGADFNLHRIRSSISLAVEHASDVANNLNMFLTRKCMKKTLLLFLVVPDESVSLELQEHFKVFKKLVDSCIDEDDVWLQVKSVHFVNYSEFFSMYGKCDTVFEGEAIPVRLKGRIKEFPSEIIPRFMFLGNYCDGTDPIVLQSLGITHIVDATGEYMSRDCAEQNNIMYFPVLIWDNATVNIATHFEAVNAFIDDCRVHPNGRILIHCRAGISRSATFVLAYLLHSHHKSSAVCDGTTKKTEEADGVSASDLREALSVVLDQRPYICPNEGFRAQLMHHETQLLGSSSFESDKDMMAFISSKNFMWAGIYSTESDFDRIPITAGRSFNSVADTMISEYPVEGVEDSKPVRPKKPFLKRGQGKPSIAKSSGTTSISG